MTRIYGLVALGVGLLSASSAQAGGMLASDLGSQGQQRGGAFVAKADDPTAVFFNPAGLAKGARYQVYVGSNFLDYQLTFDRAGTYPEWTLLPDPDYANDAYPAVSHDGTYQPLPFLAGSQRFGKLAVGEAVFGPNAYPARKFPLRVATLNSNDAPGPQRYDIETQEATIVLPSLAVAYSVTPKVDVGLRVSWGLAHMKASNNVWGQCQDDATIPIPPYCTEEIPGIEADFAMDVKDDFIPAFGLGVLFRPVPRVELGLAYQSKIAVHAEGTAQAVFDPLGINITFDPLPDDQVRCATGGSPNKLKTCMDMNLPQSVTVGGRFIVPDQRGGERADVELDVGWENWSAASDVMVTVDGEVDILNQPLEVSRIRHGYQDTWSIKLGGAYNIDLGSSRLTLRAGIAHDTAAAPDSWTRVDQDGKARTSLNGGVAFAFKNFRVDAGLGVISEPTVEFSDVPIANPDFVDTRKQPDPALPSRTPDEQLYHPFNAGRYESSYFVFGTGITAWW